MRCVQAAGSRSRHSDVAGEHGAHSGTGLRSGAGSPRQIPYKCGERSDYGIDFFRVNLVRNPRKLPRAWLGRDFVWERERRRGGEKRCVGTDSNSPVTGMQRVGRRRRREGTAALSTPAAEATPEPLPTARTTGKYRGGEPLGNADGPRRCRVLPSNSVSSWSPFAALQVSAAAVWGRRKSERETAERRRTERYGGEWKDRQRENGGERGHRVNKMEAERGQRCSRCETQPGETPGPQSSFHADPEPSDCWSVRRRHREGPPRIPPPPAALGHRREEAGRFSAANCP